MTANQINLLGAYLTDQFSFPFFMKGGRTGSDRQLFSQMFRFSSFGVSRFSEYFRGVGGTKTFPLPSVSPNKLAISYDKTTFLKLVSICGHPGRVWIFSSRSWGRKWWWTVWFYSFAPIGSFEQTPNYFRNTTRVATTQLLSANFARHRGVEWRGTQYKLKPQDKMVVVPTPTPYPLPP